jgi:tetratricopeptide (TPR) repeat protein
VHSARRVRRRTRSREPGRLLQPRRQLYAGRYADAIAAYRKALQLSPNRLAGHYHLGLAQLLSGNAAEAMQSMDREPLEVLQLLGRVMAHHALNDQDSVDPTVRIAGMARSYIPV